MKIVSPDILHKTDAGGVILDVKSREDTQKGYEQILDNVKAHNQNARILGILVQHMAPKGIEVIVGGVRDIQFGPTILFGLGGIFVEVLKDVTFRVAPLSELDSREMIHSIRAYPILTGIRGQPVADERAIMATLRGVPNDDGAVGDRTIGSESGDRLSDRCEYRRRENGTHVGLFE